MRILQVYPYFYPAWRYGGGTRVVYELSKYLTNRGHKVTVYTTDALDEKSRVKVSTHPHYVKGVKTYYFKNLSNYLASRYILPLPMGLLPRIKEEIKEFEIIHLHGSRTFLNTVVHYYAKKYGIPYVLQPHGSLPRIIEKQGLKKLYDWVWGNHILKDASKIIVVSKVEMEQCKEMGIDDSNITIIQNGLDIKRFKNLPRYGQFREKHGIGKKHMILFLGRIHKIKGVDFLIKSFACLVKEIEDVVLVIAGPDDGYRKECEKLVKDLNLKDSVKFVDYVDNVVEAYQDADVLVYPAIYEIFGLVPFEAIMCGTPVIVTDDCGCGELVKEAGCGFLVKYGDVHDLKEKMKLLLQRPELGQQMVERGKKYILKNLAWDKVVRKVEKVYEDCIHNF